MNSWHVVKVGGSLLEWSELPERLRSWVAERLDGPHVLIAGGGEIVETIRRAGSRWNIEEETCHWLAIDAMRLTARLLAELLPKAHFIDEWSRLLLVDIARGSQHAVIFDPAQFLHDVEPHLPPAPLPHTWQVTSDSIAARVAVVLRASHLTLLKSATPPVEPLAELAERGYVDEHFANIAAMIPNVSFVNLRG